MIEVRGEHSAAHVFTDDLEPSARAQIQALCDQAFTGGSRIRVMPDVHAGMGCTIGTTMTLTDTAVPNLVGVDIGCGMETARLIGTRLELPKLDSAIKANIPAGFGVRSKPHSFADEIDLSNLHCAPAMNLDRAYKSIGTLGGGNHFIEVDRDDGGALYLVIHSGSRHLGTQVAEYYQNKGFEQRGGRKGAPMPRALAYVSGELFRQYIDDMRLVQRYADLNRRAMLKEILRAMKLDAEDQFTTVHNYIDVRGEEPKIPSHKGIPQGIPTATAMILRKGAVSAQAGERLLIPMNMRDGSLVCTGLGNPDWNFSAPHGAGRLFSRSEAKRSFTVSEFTKQMAGVYTTTAGKDTLDECPMAYKPMEDIVRHIGPTARIEKVIRPVYNFKAGGE